tara:strand:- start:2414 stop:3064 length:651 start_codon:yes stop_codon:yes gene_type:complete
MSPETKNKLKLSFLLLITALPVSLATMSFKSAIENGDIAATSNKGHLINPPADISALDMRDSEGSPAFRTFEEELATLDDTEEYEIKPWLLVFVTAQDCAASCMERIHYLQQLHIALGKNIKRVRRYYVNASGVPFDTQTASTLREEYPSMGITYSDAAILEGNMLKAGAQLSLADQDYVILIDPVGNVMMYYTDEHSAEDIMTDLETLLKYSSLG